MTKKAGIRSRAARIIRGLVGIIAFGEYASVEDCIAKLLSVLGAEPSGEFGLAYALERRKKEIQWHCLYLPGTFFGSLMIYLMYGGVAFRVHGSTYICLALVFVLAVLFRITFYQEYLNINNRLWLAAEQLRNHGSTAEQRRNHVSAAEQLQNNGPAAEQLRNHEAGAGKGDAGEKKIYGEELQLLFGEASGDIRKGKIKIFLLDQLIRYECGLPSVYEGPSAHITDSVRIPGCKAKNIIAEFHDYHSRKAMPITTKNRKTTHLRYVRILMEHYKRTEAPALQEKAQDLYSFIERIKIERKIRNMRLRP